MNMLTLREGLDVMRTLCQYTSTGFTLGAIQAQFAANRFSWPQFYQYMVHVPDFFHDFRIEPTHTSLPSSNDVAAQMRVPQRSNRFQAGSQGSLRERSAV